MNVIGKTKIFVNEYEGQAGVVRSYLTSLGTKDGTGAYLNCSLRVYFGKKNFPLEKLAKLSTEKWYEFEIHDGWLTVEKFTTKDGVEVKRPALHIEDGKILEQHKIAPKKEIDDDLPF